MSPQPCTPAGPGLGGPYARDGRYTRTDAAVTHRDTVMCNWRLWGGVFVVLKRPLRGAEAKQPDGCCASTALIRSRCPQGAKASGVCFNLKCVGGVLQCNILIMMLLLCPCVDDV